MPGVPLHGFDANTRLRSAVVDSIVALRYPPSYARSGLCSIYYRLLVRCANILCSMPVPGLVQFFVTPGSALQADHPSNRRPAEAEVLHVICVLVSELRDERNFGTTLQAGLEHCMMAGRTDTAAIYAQQVDEHVRGESASRHGADFPGCSRHHEVFREFAAGC